MKNLQFEDGKMIPAAQYFSSGSSAAVELTEEEKGFAEQMKVGPPLPARRWSFSDDGKGWMLTVDGVVTGSVAEYSEQRESG